MPRRSTIAAAPTLAEVGVASSISPRIEAWFQAHGRWFPWRTWNAEFELVITELLLQRTRAPVVASMLNNFLGRYPDWETIARTPEEELRLALSGLGLQRRRAIVLRRLAAYALDKPSADYEEWPGLGQYSARAILVGRIGTKVAMVDANVVRIVRRVFGGVWRSDYRYDGRLQKLSQAIVEGAIDARRANWAMLDLGASICQPRRPRCADCPLSDLCQTGRNVAAAAAASMVGAPAERSPQITAAKAEEP